MQEQVYVPYSVTRSREAIDWWKELDWLQTLKDKKKKKNYCETESERDRREKLEFKAQDWVTCACGNQCSIIPRDRWNGHPLDPQLFILGGDFFMHIDNRNYAKAAVTLMEIEARSSELITEIRKEELKSNQ